MEMNVIVDFVRYILVIYFECFCIYVIEKLVIIRFCMCNIKGCW